MDLRNWPDADAILDQALDLPAGERHAFVRRAARDDRELIAALDAVLAEAQNDDEFLQCRAAAALLDAASQDDDSDAESTLHPGDTFATYDVLELIGRGGMGEVYSARDARLGRLVALKVLPAALARDRQRLARFDREARVLASLNHPNIAAIYGLAEDAGRQALVLEFVDGTTLAERVAQAPLEMREALRIARQMALGLESAHRRSIIHRDLKPANISTTSDGTVKVLDFGLAKAIGDDGGKAGSEAGLTSVSMPGGLLGTPAYMAPEQARGEDVDERTDIWAFGCVLFEMLAGTRAFGGGTSHEVIARVLERQPDFSLLPPNTPEALRRLLQRALTKDPKRRLADIADALLEIEEAERTAGLRGSLSWKRWLSNPVAGIAAIAIVLAAAAVAAIAGSRLFREPPPAPVVRLAVPIPASDELLLSTQQVAAISPDGHTLVYRAVRNREVGLFRRSLGSMQSELISGTRNASGPFLSPDGKWLGFDGDGVLRKVSMAGGDPITICEATGGANASWSGDTIVFATGTGHVLARVPASGGVPQRLTELDAASGDLSHAYPHVLPRADAALFTIVRSAARFVASVRFDTREVRILAPGSQPRYLTSGHLAFVRNNSLWLAPFDERTLTMTGDAVPVLENLETTSGGTAHFVFSADGSLLYSPRREEVRERQFVWLDRHGKETAVDHLEPKQYTRGVLSPDATRLAVALTEDGNTDIWVASLQSRSLVRLTREPAVDTAPLWMPDGRHLIFRSERDGGGLFRRAADGSGDADRLTASGETVHTPHYVTTDGRTLLFTELRGYTRQTIVSLDLESRTMTRLLDGDFAQLRPQVSPDGRWLAYQSDESGRFETYVRPYPAVGGTRWQISSAGGTSPRWSHTGAELFYYDGKGLMAVPVRSGPSFGPPVRLFDYAPFSGRMGPDYDVADGATRFLMIRNTSETPSTRAQLVVVQNWMNEVRQKLSRP